MARFLQKKLARLALSLRVWMLFIGIAPLATQGNEAATKGMETWLTEVEKMFFDSSTNDSGAFGGLPGLISTAQENDERQSVLQAQVEVITARAKVGRSWPDPELRLGYEERDDQDQINRRAAIRFRLPDRVDRRLLEKISQVDIDWTNQQINLLKGEIALRVKRLYAQGIFARLRLQSGAQHLRKLLEQDRQLTILQDSGQARIVESAQLLVEAIKLYRTMRKEFTLHQNSISELLSLGITKPQAKGALKVANWSELNTDQLPALGELNTLANRNSEDTLQYKREDAMLSIRLNEVKRSWLPSPSFFQLEWGNRSESGNSNRETGWGALAGFDIDLFDDHEEELLLSVRRKTDLNRKVEVEELEEKVKNSLADLLAIQNSYQHFETICEPAISSLEKWLAESEAAAGNRTKTWDTQEDLFELQNEILDMRWMLIDSLLDLETAVGQVL
jgi:hypothetical protein